MIFVILLLLMFPEWFPDIKLWVFVVWGSFSLMSY